MTNQCKFEVGDKVKRKDGNCFSNEEKIVTVSHVLPNILVEGFTIVFSETGTNLHEDDLELAEIPFTKSDLKDGMVVTYRRGEERIVFINTLRDFYAFNKQMALNAFDDDLTYPSESSLDIIKVEYMDEVLWEREELSPEQKRIKELEEGIAKASLIIEGQQGDTQELQEFLNNLL